MNRSPLIFQNMEAEALDTPVVGAPLAAPPTLLRKRRTMLPVRVARRLDFSEAVHVEPPQIVVAVAPQMRYAYMLLHMLLWYIVVMQAVMWHVTGMTSVTINAVHVVFFNVALFLASFSIFRA